MPLTLNALKSRDFRVLWIGSTLSHIGTWMHIVAQGWLMYQLTDSPLALGLVGLTRAIPLLTFPLLGGVLADRVPRLRVLYGTQSAALLLAAGLATLTVMGVVHPWHILVFSFLNATVLAFDTPARQALLPDLVTPADLMHANSLNSWSFNGAVLVGPALAAALLPLIGIGGVFYLNAVSFTAVLVALALLHITEAPLSLSAGRHNVLAGLRYVAQHPTIRSLVTMTAIISLLGRSYGQLMPVFARDFLRLDAAGMSLLYTAAGFGSFVGAMTLLLLKNPDNKGRLAFASGGGFAVALAMFSLSRLLWLSVGLLFVMGFLLMTFSTMVSTLLQTYAPAEVRGRVMSVYTISWQGLEYVGVLLTGGLASLVSTTPVVLGAAVIVGVLIATVEVAHRGAPQLQ